MIVTCTELTFREGSSDKFYRTFTLDDVAVVQYGRAGTYGTFKRTPTSDPAAATAKKIAAKQATGYRVVKAVTVSFSAAPTDAQLDAYLNGCAAGIGADQAEEATARPSAVVAGDDTFVVDRTVLSDICHTLRCTAGSDPAAPVRPMLAETIDPADSNRVLDSDDWVAQFKYDGDRYVIEVVDGAVAVYGRNGQPKVREVNAELLAPFRNLTAGRWVFDGEMVGRTLVLFDLPWAGTAIRPDNRFTSRYHALGQIVDRLFRDVPDADVVVAPVAGAVGDRGEEKRAMLAQAIEEKREGVMFRLARSGYVAGRTPVLLKHKFIREVDAVVIEVDRGGKSNAVLGLYDEAGTLVEIGQVTTIGKGRILPGHVLEVRFLYVVDPAAPRLFQPRILRVRTDKAAGECTLDQLAEAGTNKTAGVR